MNRYVKQAVLGITLASALLLPMSAEAAQFHSASENTTLKGTNINVHHFATNSFDVTCQAASFEGTQSAKTTTTLTLTAKYGPTCHVIILFTFSATINFKSCDLQFYAGGDIEVKCKTAGDQIEITSTGCNIKIPPQLITGGALYQNNGSKTRFTISSQATGIEYSQSGSSCATLDGSNASYTGAAEFSGTSGGVATAIWWE